MVFNDYASIHRYQLVTQRAAVKLEKLGMTRRGPSVTSLLRVQYGLPRNAPHDAVLAKLDAAIKELES